MGCCISSATSGNKNEPKNTALSPSGFDEETVVKEVLSETTLFTSSNNNSTATKIEVEEEEEDKKPGIVVDEAPDPVITKPEPGKGTEVSEMSSLSKSLLSIVNKYDEEEVKQITQVVRQRSPAKSRNRVMVPTRRTDLSPLKRNNEQGAGSVRLVPSRDPITRSERRSRSPAMNRSVMMGQTRSQQSRDIGGPDPNKIRSEQDRCHHNQRAGFGGNYNSTPNDTLENPLVALECFIFL